MNDGDLILMHSQDDAEGKRVVLMSTSTDGGETWSTPKEID